MYLYLPCFPDFRGKGGYTSLPPGGRPSSTVLYPGPPSSSPRPPTPPFSCLSRCNRAISYVVFLSLSHHVEWAKVATTALPWMTCSAVLLHIDLLIGTLSFRTNGPRLTGFYSKFSFFYTDFLLGFLPLAFS